ncbi:Pleckstrin y [Schistosoma japonicum]|nr:Pleckstrin y [Schistosoma japonicum]
MSIKEGYLKKWSDRKNWHNVYCKLLNSGWFQWFDNASSTSPKRSVDIRRVAAFLAFGEVIHRVPCKPTSLTASEIPLAFGVPYEPHMGTQMAWFVCPDQGTLSSWTNAIMSLFQQNNSAQPPPPYQPPAPAAPPGVIGFGTVPLSQPPVPAAAPGAYVPGTSSYGGYPQQQPPQAQQGQYFVGRNGQPYQVVYVDGLASGVAGGYLASRLFGGWGWGGGCGGLMGPRWGSWSSLSSLSWSD